MISTHTPHAGRDVLSFCFHPRCAISTHTPHAGRDENCQIRRSGWCDFYSHAPCGARRNGGRNDCRNQNFYSHAPCGARQIWSPWIRRSRRFLLTRPMRGATKPHHVIVNTIRISTHTPHAGRDSGSLSISRKTDISTHTPHAGRDGSFAADRRHLQDFYSHAPCGARRVNCWM